MVVIGPGIARTDHVGRHLGQQLVALQLGLIGHHGTRSDTSHGTVQLGLHLLLLLGVGIDRRRRRRRSSVAGQARQHSRRSYLIPDVLDEEKGRVQGHHLLAHDAIDDHLHHARFLRRRC